jgi:threonine/homoserine/homoserine lactone efflux protein
MGVTAMTTYLPDQARVWNVLLVAAWFTLINIPCVGVWAGCGSAMRSYLQDPVLSRIFNITMALALVASLYPMLTG